MDRLGTGLLGDLDDLVDHEVALGGRARAEQVRLVGAPDVRRVAIGLGVDGHAGDAELLERSHHADGDLAAVCDQDLFEHLRAGRLSALPTAGAVPIIAQVTRGLLAPLLLAAGLALAIPASAAAKLDFKRCGDDGPACARLSVPLDRSGAVPGNVSLLVQRVRARRAGGATRPPLFVLAGGPGQSATYAFGGEFIGDGYPAHRDRDAIIFDQRGTGKSGLLRCRRLERSNLLRAGPAAGACARSLGERRAFYTSRDSADDIEAIREQLGAERIALYGTSYGTKLALGYAKRYPARVERLVLDSVVELEGPDPFYRDSMEAVPRALRSLCGRRCPWTSDPVADVSALVERIASRGPLRGRAGGPERKAARGPTHARGPVQHPGGRRLRPGAARRGARRDARRAAAATSRRCCACAAAPFRSTPCPRRPRSLSSAVYAATSCEEVSLPWARTTPPDPAERHRQAEAQALHRARLGLRALRPCHRAGERHARPLRELAERAAGAGVRPGAAAGRAGAAGRGRGRPAHPGGERAARGGAVPPVEPRGGAGDRSLRARLRLQRLHRPGLQALPRESAGADALQALPPHLPADASAAHAPVRRGEAARQLRRARARARGRQGDRVRRGRRLTHRRSSANSAAAGHRARWWPAGRALPDHEGRHAEAARGGVRARHDAHAASCGTSWGAASAAGSGWAAALRRTAC